ncbi:hypothetical protein P7C70_g2047, partial [Phenoliferia sp. Uapishka_3]
MHTTTLITLTLALPTLLLAGSDGSLEALLNRVSERDAPATPVGTVATSASVSESTNRLVEDVELEEADDSSSDRMVRKKRYVWATSIIQDDTPTDLPVGVNANLLDPNGPALTTPENTLVAPTFPALFNTVTSTLSPLASSTSSAAQPGLPTAVAQVQALPVAPVALSQRVGFAQHHGAGGHHQKLAKKWVWGTSIIQDGDVAPTESADTPAATLVAPTFPALTTTVDALPTPAAQAVGSLIVSNSSILNSTSIIASVANLTASSTATSLTVNPSAVFVALAEANREAIIQLRKDDFEVKQVEAEVQAFALPVTTVAARSMKRVKRN